jgi:superfamily II DNA or RNA helicase
LGTLEGLLAKFSDDPHVRGRQFERVCRWYLLNDPAYSLMLREVWLWDDWPGRWGSDAGIDLVAETTEGEVWAIQAKCYGKQYAVKKADIDSFLSESSRVEFAYRLIIATTDYVGPTALRTLAQQEKPAHTQLLASLEAAEVDWPPSPDDLLPRRLPPKQPYPHNEAAVEAVLAGFEKTDRGQVIMACGTGKTLVALWVTERIRSDRTLVLVPSLSLLAQTLREWSANKAHDFTFLPVCSDETVSGEDHFISNTVDLGFPVTTDPERIAAFLRSPGPSVVFSTYQSSPKIAEAFEADLPWFDLVLADEAHRVAGAPSATFATVLDTTRLRAKRRLFLTATPRYLSARLKAAPERDELRLVSMDDEQTFGPVFHRLTFGQAIAERLLSDYQVVVVGVDEQEYARYVEEGRLIEYESGGVITDARTLASQVATVKSIAKFDLHRVLSFHGRVKAAKSFADSIHGVPEMLPLDERPSGRLYASHVSGRMPSGERDRRLRSFGQAGQDDRTLLSNVRCLAEGVDVPSIDGLAFIDPRSSEVDIVQAVGRVLRRSPSKTIGTVLLPVFLHSSDDEATISGSAFAAVWSVLLALRAHDEELGEQLDALRRSIGRRAEGRLCLPGKIKLDFPVSVGSDFMNAFTLRLIERTTRSWEFWMGLLEEYAKENGDTAVPVKEIYRGHPLGLWVSHQRMIYNNGARGSDGQIRWARRGFLTAAGIHELEAMNGWSWNPADDLWEDRFQRVSQLDLRLGDQRYRDADGFAPFLWIYRQRQEYHKGTLEPDRVSRLEALDNWSWGSDRPSDKELVAWVAEYAARTGSFEMPRALKLRNTAIRAWLDETKKRIREGTADPSVSTALELLPGWSNDPIVAKTGRPNQEKWLRTFQRLKLLEESGTNLAEMSTLFVGPDGFQAGYWVSSQRRKYRMGLLSAERTSLLEGLPTWSWSKRDDAFAEGLRSLSRFVAREGHATPPHRYRDEDGFGLSSWIDKQRRKHRAGKLQPHQVQALEQVESWKWNLR